MIWCRERTERRLTFYIIFYQALIWLTIALIYLVALKELTPYDVGVALWIAVGVNATSMFRYTELTTRVGANLISLQSL